MFEDDGFRFDAGPTVITDPACLEELFELSGRKLSDYVELISVAPFYRLLWEDGSVFNCSNDDAELFRQIKAFNPNDAAGYRKFLEFSDDVFNEGYQKLGHEAFLDFKSMLKAAPQLMPCEAFRSVYAMVARRSEDDRLRHAFRACTRCWSAATLSRRRRSMRSSTRSKRSGSSGSSAPAPTRWCAAW